MQLYATTRVTTDSGPRPTQNASHTLLRPRIRHTHPYILFNPGGGVCDTRLMGPFGMSPEQYTATATWPAAIAAVGTLVVVTVTALYAKGQFDEARRMRLSQARPSFPGGLGGRRAAVHDDRNGLAPKSASPDLAR